MNEPARKRGRPPADPATVKRQRGVSMPDAYWARLESVQSAMGATSCGDTVAAILDAVDVDDVVHDAWLRRVKQIDWSDYEHLVHGERMVARALRDLGPPKELESFVECALDTAAREWGEANAVDD